MSSKEEKHARLSAIRAVITGQLPTIEKTVIQVINIKRGRQKIRKEKAKGRLVNASSRWTDKSPPIIMSRLDEINADPDVETAITNLTEMVAAGFFTEMGQDVPKVTDQTTGKEKPHPNKVKLDAWAEKHRADEVLKMAVREAFKKAFSP